jgi:acyl-CoA thioester hydrolase
VRVYYQDTDAGGVVFHASYLDFLERARMDWMRARGFDARELANRYQVLFIVRKLQVAYLKPALLDDMLMASAVVQSIGQAQATFAQQVRRNDETLVRAAVNVACVAAGSLKPAALPEKIRALLTADIAPPDFTTPANPPRRHLNRV